MTDRELAKMLRIGTNTKCALKAWDVALERHSTPQEVRTAAQGILWALATGRLGGTVHLWVTRELSSYQQVKLLNYVTQNAATVAEGPSAIVRYWQEVVGND